MSIKANFSEVTPSLVLDFANSKTLDPRITFTRASTATYVDAGGLIKTAGINEARFDHDPVTGRSLGLLIEENRSNLFINSSVIFNDGRSIADTIYGINLYTATGNTNTVAYNSATGTGNSGFFSITSGQTYAVSFYAKQGTSSGGLVRFISNIGTLLTNEVSYSIPVNGGRVVSIVTANSTSSVAQVQIVGVSNGTTFTLGGFQVEVGSFPTSYIPTTTSQLTRSADSVTMTGTNFSSWYNQSEGSIFASLRSNPGTRSANNVNVFGITPVSGPWTGNLIGQNTDSNGTWYSYDSSFSNLLQTSNLSSSVNKFSWGLTSGSSSSVVVDGTIKSSFNWGSVTRTSLFLGYDFSGSMWWNKILYYPKRLTNDQLQNLTK